MALDIFAMQQTLDGLLSDACTAAGVVLSDTFGLVNINDDATSPMAAQTFFMQFSPAGQVGRSAAHQAVWSFDVYVDVTRATPTQKTAAMTLFSAALAALVGAEIGPGRVIEVSDGQPSGFENHVMRISFGFTVPVYLAG